MLRVGNLGEGILLGRAVQASRQGIDLLHPGILREGLWMMTGRDDRHDQDDQRKAAGADHQ
jgi:hypothetical protein